MLVVCKKRIDDRYEKEILPIDYDSTENFARYDEEGEEGDTDTYDLSVLMAPDRYRDAVEEEERMTIRPIEEPLVEAERITPAKTAVTCKYLECLWSQMVHLVRLAQSAGFLYLFC